MAEGLALLLAHLSTGFRCLDSIADTGVDVVRSEQLDSLLGFVSHQPNWLFVETVSPNEPRTLTAIERLRHAFPTVPLYLISAQPGPERTGTTVLLWPRDRHRLETLLGRTRDTAPRNATEAHALIGRSKAMQTVRKLLQRAAEVDSPVLLSGETGTGKEVAAQTIHRFSRRAHHPWVSVNCAAIPESLLESEMFGHARGAFTGAHKQRFGKLRTAHMGTLFLDEVGELSLRDQAKLLRALETRTVSPLGSDRTENVDVRLVAATNQPLEQLIADRQFRQDLFYRLNVVRIHLPPLRERREDIQDLCAHFVAEFNRAFACQVVALDRGAMDCLGGYDWPGNVRELRNAIEVGFINRDDSILHLDDFPGHICSATGGRDNERDQLLKALIRTRWNRTDTARLLGCSRMTVYRKMRKYGLAETIAGAEGQAAEVAEFNSPL